MEDKILFGAGYMPSLDRLSLPKGAYLDAVNMMRDSMGNIQNEHGTAPSFDFAAGAIVNGLTMVGDDIVVAATFNGVSSVGVLNIDDNYQAITSNPALSFGTRSVQMEARINYKGERLLYIGGEGTKLRRLNLDDVPSDDDFDKSTSLFLEYELPYVEGVEVASGGSVLSGVYQFACRLITASNNATSFGTLTGVIPVGTGTQVDGRKNVDGAAPQTLTSNLISLQVSNIDTSFEFFEPCVITYLGESNQLSIKSLGRRSIANRTEVSFSYSGTEDEVDTILEEELNIDSTLYESAKYMTQKDSTLILGGLQEKEDDIDWQSVANSIVMKFTSHQVSRTEEISAVNNYGSKFDDLPLNTVNSVSNTVWTDEGTLEDFNDYKNPIACAKFRGYRRNEVYSFTFTPIFKGGRRGNAYHIPALTSEEATALGASSTINMLRVAETKNFTYPEGFGALTNQLVRYHRMPEVQSAPFYVQDGDQEYVRFLGVTAEILSTENWKNTLSGYIIGREDRAGKETMLAQGIVKDFYRSSIGVYVPAPGVGNTHVIHTHENEMDYTDHNQAHKSIFSFHAPDLQINPSPDYVPTKIRRIAKYAGKVEFNNSGNKNINDRMKSMVNAKPGTHHNDVVDLQDGLRFIKGESQSASDNHREGPENVNLSRTLFDINLRYRRMSECFGIKTAEELPKSRSFAESFHDRNGEDIYWYTENSRTMDVELYNLETERVDYYGGIYGKKSMPINTVLFERGSINPKNSEVLADNYTVSFGGDTFISKFAMVPKTTVAFNGTIGKYQTIPATDYIIYVMVESYNNYNYRHYEEASAESNGTPSYYPKQTLLSNNSTNSTGVADLTVAKGTAALYNKQYTAQNTLKPTFSKSVGEDIVTEFSNRIVYSATSIEGEQFDSYRLFLIANYHDVPKQFGKITGLFSYGSDLYTHTERCLWKNFYNTLATQATSAGDIVLGNGGAFPRPSVPIITVDGGYAGCKDISASVSTPMGRYFFDAYKSKLYLLSEGLKEISNPAVFEKLRAEAYGKDAVLGYDFGRKRILMSTSDLTLSYNPQLNGFDGRHTYSFDHFISRDIKDYMIKDNLIHHIDSKVLGTYFNEVHESKLSVMSSGIFDMSKQFTSVYTTLSAFKADNFQHLPLNFFDKFRAYSYERNTDMNIVKLIDEHNTDFADLGEVEVHKVNNKYRMAMPPDVVIDPNVDIFDVTNLATSPAVPSEDKLFLPEMVDNHIVLEFVIDNNNQRVLRVNSFIINFEENHS